MTLADICEPVFQHVCRLNRLGRKGQRADAATVRAELKSLLQQVRSKAEATPGMIGPYEGIESILVYFADSMISSGDLRFAGGWKPISHDPGVIGLRMEPELGFEERFWDMLEEALRDPSEGATQRLTVYYTCIGLGFTGLYTGQPDYVKRKSLEIASRLRGNIDADFTSKLCQDAYENVDERALNIDRGRRLVGLVLVLVTATVVLLAGYVWAFRDSSRALTTALTDVVKAGSPQDTPQ
jgi:hypothetical protein